MHWKCIAIHEKTIGKANRGAAQPRGVWPISNVLADLLRGSAVTECTRPRSAGLKINVETPLNLSPRLKAEYSVPF